MHILFVASYAPSLLNFRGPLIRDLLALGHQISVCAPCMESHIIDDLSKLGAKSYDIPLQRNKFSLLSDLTYLISLVGLMRRIRPDTVLTYTIKPNIWGAFAARYAKASSVAMVTGLGYAFSESEGTWKSRISRSIARILYRSATRMNKRVVFQNPDDRDDFVKFGCLSDRSKIRMVDGSGVDLERFQRTQTVNEPVFLMISRLVISKGVREYARAAKMVRERYPEAKFILVGPDDEGPDAVSLSELTSWKAEGAIIYAGPKMDVRPCISKAAVLVLPSYREGTPRSVLEAMAMGRPIITTDAPGCRETIRSGVEGFLVPPKDEKALANAIERFVKEPPLIELMGNAAYIRVSQKYAVERINERMIEILELG